MCKPIGQCVCPLGNAESDWLKGQEHYCVVELIRWHYCVAGRCQDSYNDLDRDQIADSGNSQLGVGLEFCDVSASQAQNETTSQAGGNASKELVFSPGVNDESPEYAHRLNRVQDVFDELAK